MGIYNILFRTYLNETLTMRVKAKNEQNAINKLLKEFPKKKHGTYDIELTKQKP